MQDFLSIFFELDSVLGEVVRDFGVWTYAILFLVIFCETGLVVTPFLPGDSLIFAAGTFAAAGAMDPLILSAALIVAAIAGDTVNYWIGRSVGLAFFLKNPLFKIREEHLQKTRVFYERHGAKTVVLARFVPIIRTFAPFVAGMARMEYRKFLTYNVAGGIAWVVIFVCLGYFFGNIPLVQENFTLAILTIIFASIIPGFVGYIKSKREARGENKEAGKNKEVGSK